jgi:hypothetical protein
MVNPSVSAIRLFKGWLEPVDVAVRGFILGCLSLLLVFYVTSL